MSFSAPTDFAGGESPVSVATGDFNADNDPDLAVANRFSSDVSVLLGAAAGGFTGPTSFPTGFFSNSVAVGNFDGDQDPDLAVAIAFDGTVSVLLGGPGGGFTGPTDFAAGSPYVVAVGDFNRERWATSTGTGIPTWWLPTTSPATSRCWSGGRAAASAVRPPSPPAPAPPP